MHDMDYADFLYFAAKLTEYDGLVGLAVLRRATVLIV
jgi:hypothetical protein